MAVTTRTRSMNEAVEQAKEGVEGAGNYLIVDDLMIKSDLNKHLIWSTSMNDSSRGVNIDDGNETDRLLSTTTMALKDTENVRENAKSAVAVAEGPSTSSSGSLMEVTKYNSNDEIMRFNTALVLIPINLDTQFVYNFNALSGI